MPWRLAIELSRQLAGRVAELRDGISVLAGRRKGHVSRNRLAVAAMFSAILEKSLSADEAVARLEALPREHPPDEVIADAYHYLLHYREDADIRERDGGYAEMQWQGLATWLERLER
jgi:hypothetical protein